MPFKQRQIGDVSVGFMIALRGNALHCGGVKYGILFGGTGKLFAFNAGNISLVVQITYYWISSVSNLYSLNAEY